MTILLTYCFWGDRNVSFRFLSNRVQERMEEVFYRVQGRDNEEEVRRLLARLTLVKDACVDRGSCGLDNSNLLLLCSY